MPSTAHELLVQMGSQVPDFLRALLRAAIGIEVSAIEPSPGPEGVVNLKHPPYRADAVLLERSGAGVVRVMVFEVQLKKNEAKRISWPVYMAVLRAQYRVPVQIIVLTTSRAIARWCAEPIVLDGGASVVVPSVIGPDEIPKITEVERAKALPELAVLSVMAHGRSRHAEAIGRAALAAVEPLDPDTRALYADVIFQHLGKRAREVLEAEMRIEGYEFKSPILKDAFAKGKAEGKAEGKAAALLNVLEAQGVVVDERTEHEVLACRDEKLLDTWLENALTAKSLADVFE